MSSAQGCFKRLPCQIPPTPSSLFGPQVLAELKEYATEVDVDFVRKAVRAIGRCAIKVEVRLWDCVLGHGTGRKLKPGNKSDSSRICQLLMVREGLRVTTRAPKAPTL